MFQRIDENNLFPGRFVDVSTHEEIQTAQAPRAPRNVSSLRSMLSGDETDYTLGRLFDESSSDAEQLPRDFTTVQISGHNSEIFLVGSARPRRRFRK